MQESKKVKLYSRYKDISTELEYIDSSRGIITSNSEYTRVIFKNEDEKLTPDDKIQAVDYEGGPMLSVGDIVDSHKIKSIRFVQLIEFE